MTSLEGGSQTASDRRHEEPVRRALADPVTAVAVVVYLLAVVGLFLAGGDLWSTLLLGLAVALLSGVVVWATRRRAPRPIEVLRPRVEAWLPLVWYGLVTLLAVVTSAVQLELVNQFTNWFFLVIVPLGLLLVARRRGLAVRAALRSIGITRAGLGGGLRLAALIVPLSIPALYVVGERQRMAVAMMFQEPLRAVVSLLVGFLLALLTVGFVEEFFFRGILQSRLARWIGSEWRGLLVASLLFGLFHLPMAYFSPYEPMHGNLLGALSGVVAEQAVMGILLGVLWARTRNLAAPLLVHVFTDALAMMTMVRIGIG